MMILVPTVTSYAVEGKNSFSRSDPERQRLPDLNPNHIDSVVMGRQHAENMVRLIQDRELQKALEKIMVRGKQTLLQNEGLHGTALVIAGATSLWVGRTIKLIRGKSFAVDQRIEGRNRAVGLNFRTSIFETQTRYQSGMGLSLQIGHTIPEIKSSFGISYNQLDQSTRGIFSHELFPHLNINFGAGRSPAQSGLEGNATLNYNIEF